MNKLFLVLFLLISACSTMKSQECVNANWRDIGFNDAIQGRTVWLESRTQTCAKANLKPNKSAYIAGHREGSIQFCTYKNGYNYGRRNEVRTPICVSPNLSKPFYDGYKEGLSAYEDSLDRYESMFGRFGMLSY